MTEEVPGPSTAGRRALWLANALVALSVCAGPALAAASSSLPADPAPTSTASRSALLAEGVRLELSGDLAGADQVWDAFIARFPDDPAGPLQRTTTHFWRQSFDENNRDYDARLEDGIASGLALAEARLAANEADALAHFHRGMALMLEARLELTRDALLRAGRAGEQGRKSLERALALDPTLEDARYFLGQYYYYAGVLPSVFQWLSWLPFVPKGDRELGLRYLEQARNSTAPRRHEASFILLNVHTYLEQDGKPRARELARELHARFPENSVFHFELIEVLAARGDWEGVIAEARLLEAHDGRRFHDAGRRRMARVWRAGALLELGRTDEALAALEPFSVRPPASPSWARAWIQLTRGRAHDLRGERERARAFYREVIDLEPPQHSRRASAFAKQAMETPYASNTEGSPGP